MESSYLLHSLRVCTCDELKCSAEKFEYEGCVYAGKARDLHNGKLHDTKVRRIRQLRTTGPKDSGGFGVFGGVRRRRSLSTGDVPHSIGQSASRATARSPHGLSMNPSTSCSQNNEVEAETTSLLEFCTKPFRVQPVYLIRPSSLISLLQIAKASITGRSSDHESRSALHLIKLQAEQTAVENNHTGRAYWNDIPTTVPRLYSMLDLDVSLTTESCCPQCFALHGPMDLNVETEIKQRCDELRFLKDPTKKKQDLAKVLRSKCNKDLYSTVDNKRVPNRVFHYQSLKKWLARLMFLPGFEDMLDTSLTREGFQDTSVMADVWDGDMWKTFERDGQPYTMTSGNLVFALYVDWFNPHGRGAKRHISSGTLLLICLNLPPDVRYHEEYIFLFGTIPGPQEPQLDQINHLLKPLVAEFQDFWKGIFFTSTARHPGGRPIHAAIWPIIADIPAMRKSGGLAGCAATLFCAHCGLHKDHISELDEEKWPDRFDHQQHAEDWKNAKSLTEQNSIFTTFGVRWSILSELPYWQPINFMTIDVMHNILLGMLSDHANSFLGIAAAGKRLKAKQLLDTAKTVLLPVDDSAASQAFPSDDMQEDVPASTGSLEVNDDFQEEVLYSAESEEIPSDVMDVEALYSAINKDDVGDDMMWEETLYSANSEDIISSSLNLDACDTSPNVSRSTFQPSSHTHPSDLVEGHSHLDERSSSPPRAFKKRSRLSHPRRDSGRRSSRSEISINSDPQRLRRSGRLAASSSATTKHIQKQVARQRRLNTINPTSPNQTSGSDSGTTARASSRPPPRKKRVNPTGNTTQPAASKPNHKASETNPLNLTMADLFMLQEAVSSVSTPTWLTKPPRSLGTASAGSLKASEWHSLYTVYMVLSTIPDLYNSQDANRLAMCRSVIQAAEITNYALSHTFSPDDGKQLGENIKCYREHLKLHWPDVSIKPNLHMAQHLPQIATLFGPPTYTASWAGERMNGILIKIPKNRHIEDLDKTMCTSFIRRGLFKVMINNAPTYLSKVDEKLRPKVLESLTGDTTPKWSIPTSLDINTYHSWLSFLNHDVKGKYGSFSDPREPNTIRYQILPNLVQTIKRLRLYGKMFSVHSIHKGNSMVEFNYQGQRRYGYIVSQFRASKIPTTFLSVSMYSSLSSTDLPKNFYQNHPKLYATIVYDKVETLAVIDSGDLIGHISVKRNPAGTFGISEPTVSAVGLRNMVFAAPTEADGPE